MAHRRIDPGTCSAADAASLGKSCALAFRSNLARMITGLDHRDFCIRLADSTCLKAPIHHPVDWVLLRDTTRTLMKSVERIRGKGLVSRMPKDAMLFLSEMNTFCMEMTAKNRHQHGESSQRQVEYR